MEIISHSFIFPNMGEKPWDLNRHLQQEVSCQKLDFDLIPAETHFGAFNYPQARRILEHASAEIPVEDRRERARGKFGSKKRPSLGNPVLTGTLTLQSTQFQGLGRFLGRERVKIHINPVDTGIPAEQQKTLTSPLRWKSTTQVTFVFFFAV